MSGIGIGRFARRKTAAEKTPRDVSEGAAATATRRIIPPSSTAAANKTGNGAEFRPSSGGEKNNNNTAWDDLSDGGFRHRDDFSFSDHGGGDGGAEGFFLFDDNSIGSGRSIDASFDLGRDGFHDGASFGDGYGYGSDFGTERRKTDATPGTSVAKPNGTFGFSRFAKKNESKANGATALDANGSMDPNKGRNDESNAVNPSGKGEPVSVVNKTGGSNSSSNNGGGDGTSSSSSNNNQDHQTGRNSNEASSIATGPAPSQTKFSALYGNPLSRHSDPAPREESRRVSLDNHHTNSDSRTDRPDPTSGAAEPNDVLQPQNKRQKRQEEQEQQEQRSMRPSSSFPASVRVLDSVHQQRKQMQQTSNAGENPRATEKPIAIIPTNTSVGRDDNSAIFSDSGKKPGIASRIDHSSNPSRGTSESSRRVSTGNEVEAGRNQIRNQRKQNQPQGQNQNQYRHQYQYQYQYQYQQHQEPTHLQTRVRDSNPLQKPVPLVAAVTPTPPVVPARDGRSDDAENHTARSRSSSNIVPRPNNGRATAVAGTMHGASQNQSGCDRNVRNGMATGSHNKDDNGSANHESPGTEKDQRAIDNGRRPEILGDIGNIGSEVLDRSDQQMKNTSEDEDAFEFRQAKFLADIRETEDIQDLIEADLRTANHRFAEHYALLLRDLDAAVDLLDKLEAIEEAAEDVLARYSCDEHSFFGCSGEHAISNEKVGSNVAD